MRFIFFIIWTLHFFGHSQQSGQVVYTVHKNPSFKLEEHPDLSYDKNLFGNIIKGAEELKMVLEFNKTESKFGLVSQMSNDLYGQIVFGSRYLVTLGNAYVYYDSKTKTIAEQKDNFGNNLIVQSKITDLTWTVTKETKQIDQYICYRAFATTYSENKEENLQAVSIEAWFCPELNFNFGPFQSCDLPGLVLEYQQGPLLIYRAEKITLYENEVQIEKPTGKVMSKNEFNNRVKSRF